MKILIIVPDLVPTQEMVKEKSDWLQREKYYAHTSYQNLWQQNLFKMLQFSTAVGQWLNHSNCLRQCYRRRRKSRFKHYHFPIIVLKNMHNPQSLCYTVSRVSQMTAVWKNSIHMNVSLTLMHISYMIFASIQSQLLTCSASILTPLNSFPCI